MNTTPVITRKFKWAENYETGLDGWLPMWVAEDRGFTPVTSFGVSHDILEHRRKEDADFSHEIMAFGRMIYTRVVNGWFIRTRGTNVEEDLARELMDLWLDSGGASIGCRPPKRRTRPLEDEYAERSCERLARYMRERAEILRNDVDGQENHTEHEVPSKEALECALDLLRVGYRDAARRYRDVICARSLFDAITEEVNRHGLIHEKGDVLTLKVDTRSIMVTSHVNPPYGRWH